MIYSVKEIRQAFLSYFEKQGHTVVESSSLIPENDLTLLFVNAGMVQFKNVFVGKEERPYLSAVSTQKCIRAGGKHNDLDNVGYTARHHTFFEMLGNFSFGEYFKEKAIFHAWHVVTEVFFLSKDRLYVTVHSSDDESRQLWKKIASLQDERIISIDSDDNFWSMGSTGPCGPCTEIFYDHGEEVFGGLPGSVHEDGDRFIEIWNIVFMQYERTSQGDLLPLPKPCVDTGMGLERIAAVLQNKHNNFEIDLFARLIQEIEKFIHRKLQGDELFSARVIVDHLRSVCFLMAEGVLPSNEGRGYVVRRIMRRALRHVYLLSPQYEFDFVDLFPALLGEMGDVFPELERFSPFIVENLKQENDRFKGLLQRGLELLEKEISRIKGKKVLSGEVAFKLYDTFGFPLDLTCDILKSHDMSVDIEGFEKHMSLQKSSGRASWLGGNVNNIHPRWVYLKHQGLSTQFLGYSQLKSQGRLEEILIEGQPVESVKNIGQEMLFLSNVTPFYAESGGQVADTGLAFSPYGKAKVLDVQKILDTLWIHKAQLLEGVFKIKDPVTLKVDKKRRYQITAHHSAVHLTHEVLRIVLGKHVLQKGSHVDENSFRFDFSHNKPLTLEDIYKIEEMVNERIRKNLPVYETLSLKEEAIQRGAQALFSEKYGSIVRVVEMGDQGEDTCVSLELCGGTHVSMTGEIGYFKIFREMSLGSNLRRIECVVGQKAFEYGNHVSTVVDKLSQLLSVTSQDIVPRVESLLDMQRSQEKQIMDLKKKMALGGDYKKIQPVMINHFPVYLGFLKDISVKDLKSMVDKLKGTFPSLLILLISQEQTKLSFVLGLTDDLQTQYDAVELLHHYLGFFTGEFRGGGKRSLAQGGGQGSLEEARLAGEKFKNYLSALD